MLDRRMPVGRVRALLGFSAAVLIAGCGDAERAHAEGPAATSARPAPRPPAAPSPTHAPPPPAPPASAARMAPLTDAAWLERLAVPGQGDSMVSVPLGADAPRPILIGAHGNGDRPEWACGEWRGVTGAFPFILCPHGVQRGATLSFRDGPTTRAEIDAGLDALRARFGRYVAEGPLVYAGFSRGAIVGVPLVVADPARFPRAAFVEGGHGGWTPEAVARYAEGGGERVLFGCTTRACEQATRPVLARFARTRVEARMVSAGNIGHLVNDRVVEALKPGWAWLVEGDPRYARH